MESGPIKLHRTLTWLDLSAIGVNQILGASVFLIGAPLAASLGSYSLPAIAIVGLANILIGFTMAEVASRFDATGGPYLYTRIAFGRFAGLQVGWLQWMVRVTTYAAVANALSIPVGQLWPAASIGMSRVCVVVVTAGIFTAVVVRGMRQSANLVNALGVLKVSVLLCVIVLGASELSSLSFPAINALNARDSVAALLLLVFTFGGFEVVTVPAGETRAPRHSMPIALPVAISVVALLSILLQWVLLSVVPNLPNSSTPVADAARQFLGPAGEIYVSAGMALSIAGGMFGGLLAASRVLFAMADCGDLPHGLAKLHPRYNTPYVSVVLTGVAVVAVSLNGSFISLAAASAVTRLIMYLAVCAAAIRFRLSNDLATSYPAVFKLRGGLSIPILAALCSLSILVGIRAEQWQATAWILLIGTLLYVGRTRLLVRAQTPR
jgi:amino acid transporter